MRLGKQRAWKLLPRIRDPFRVPACHQLPDGAAKQRRAARPPARPACIPFTLRLSLRAQTAESPVLRGNIKRLYTRAAAHLYSPRPTCRSRPQPEVYGRQLPAPYRFRFETVLPYPRDYYYRTPRPGSMTGTARLSRTRNSCTF